MKAWRGSILCWLLLLGAGELLSGFDLAQGAELSEAKVLEVGSEVDYPPFATGRTAAEASGFTVELFAEVAKEAGIAYRLRVAPFHELLAEFQAGRIDVMINLAQSEGRRGFADFSVPHVTAYGGIFVRAGEHRIRSVEELAERRLLVVRADLPHDLALARGWGKPLATASDAASALRMLAAGEHDALLMSRLVGLQTLRSENISGVKVAPEPVRDIVQRFSFAVRRGNAELLARLNDGLAITRANGVYDALHAKWFGALEPDLSLFNRRAFLRFALPLMLALALVGLWLGREIRQRRRIEHARLSLAENERRLAQALQRTEGRYERLVTSLGEIVTEIGRDGRFTYLNPAWERTFGYDLAESLGRHWGEFVHPEDRTVSLGRFHRVLAGGGEGGQPNVRVLTKSGQARVMEEHLQALRDLSGEITGVAGTLVDVTERKQQEGTLLNRTKELEAAKQAAFSMMQDAEHQRRAAEHALALLTLTAENLRRSEENLAVTLNSIGDGVLTADNERRVTRLNPVAEALTGWSRDEAIGRPVSDVFRTISEATRAPALIPVDKVLATGEIHGLGDQIVLISRQGGECPINESAAPIRDKDGRIIGVVLVFRDVREERRAKHALEHLNEQLEERVRERSAEVLHSYSLLQAAMNSTADGLLVVNMNGEVTGVNPRFYELWRIPERLRGTRDDKKLMESAAEQLRDPDGFVEAVRALYAAPERESFDILELKDGRAYERYSMPQVLENRIVGRVWSFRDVTVQKRQEHRRTASATLTDKLNGALTPKDTAAVILGVIDGLFGWEVGCFDLYDGAADEMHPVMTLAGRGGEKVPAPPVAGVGKPSGWARRALSDGGAVLSMGLEGSGAPGPLAEGMDPGWKAASMMSACARRGAAPIALVTIQTSRSSWYGAEDLAMLQELMGYCATTLERIRAQTALAESQQRYERVVANISDALLVDDVQGRVVFVNDRFLELFGFAREDLASLRMEDYVAPEFRPELRERHQRRVRGEHVAEAFEYEGLRRDGKRMWLEVRAAAVLENGELKGTQSLIRDVTERKLAEKEQRRSQRLESIGTLAGGIAHDLNNALAPILMGVEILAEKYPNDSEIVELIHASTKRGADMVRQLLTFAKGMEGERVALNPAKLVDEIARMLKGTFPKNIQLVVKCERDLPVLRGDATQVHQVLVNLCVNARDAMPLGGTLTLEAQRMEAASVRTGARMKAKPGVYVALRVRDTGEGISPEILDQIFDPFFTTKGPDKGTGLGLSTVLGIVKGHGGFLEVESRLGEGSAFTVCMPADHPAAEQALEAQADGEFRGRGETILFVDDEAPVRELGRAVLGRLNFNAVTAEDGADGLMQVTEHRNNLRAIITDLHMPHMDGLAFAQIVRRMLPGVAVVVASGHLGLEESEQFKALGITTHLHKPFTEAELAAVLGKVLRANMD